jgi:hypothetical protein
VLGSEESIALEIYFLSHGKYIPSQKNPRVRLTVCKETVAAYCENRTNQIHLFCEQDAMSFKC